MTDNIWRVCSLLLWVHTWVTSSDWILRPWHLLISLIRNELMFTLVDKWVILWLRSDWKCELSIIALVLQIPKWLNDLFDNITKFVQMITYLWLNYSASKAFERLSSYNKLNWQTIEKWILNLTIVFELLKFDWNLRISHLFWMVRLWKHLVLRIQSCKNKEEPL